MLTIRELLKKHIDCWKHRSFVVSGVVAGILFLAAVAISNLANQYATLHGTIPVSDLILSNIRVFDVDAVVIYGPLVILAAVLTILALRPTAFPFTLKTLGTFIIIRAGFISLTHLGQFSPQLSLSPNEFLNFLGGGSTGGLFFSGHTGVPLLLGLIFWDNRRLRYGFIALSIILGAAMLLGHLHYTIDVIGAFFITPTIYRLAQRLPRCVPAAAPSFAITVGHAKLADTTTSCSVV